MNKSREQLLLEHNNSYLSSMIIPAQPSFKGIISVNIVIPVFNGNDLLVKTLPYTITAIQRAQEAIPGLCVSLTIVDDGSDQPFMFPYDTIEPGWNVVRHIHNHGRARTRNTGLRFGDKSKYTIFLDADIILYPDAVRDLIHTQELFFLQHKNAVVCGLFHFTDMSIFENNNTKFNFTICNDFRLHCIYQDSWIGCENDRQYIGAEFNIIRDTQRWSEWPSTGHFGPWILPNMVLGGLFCVNTEHALSVGGFDERFSTYGFEETTLVTNLIIMRQTFIIPVLSAFSKHIESNNNISTRHDKDKLFRRAYAHYFYVFMKESVATTCRK